MCKPAKRTRSRGAARDVLFVSRRIVDVTVKKSPPSEPMGRIIQFRSRRPISPRARYAQDEASGSPVKDLGEFEHTGEEDDYRHRMIVNGVAFAIAVLLILAGVWLATTMAQM